jgi:hypothetical protein
LKVVAIVFTDYDATRPVAVAKTTELANWWVKKHMGEYQTSEGGFVLMDFELIEDFHDA